MLILLSFTSYHNHNLFSTCTNPFSSYSLRDTIHLSKIRIEDMMVAPSQLEIERYDFSLVVKTFIFGPYPLKSASRSSLCSLSGVVLKLDPPPTS